MADSPGSPLSSHASSEFMDDMKREPREASADIDMEEFAAPPSKRQRTSATRYKTSEPYIYTSVDGDVSSDSERSAPSSPIIDAANVADDDDLEQVTVCRWAGCSTGDLGNMDELVGHINDVHIPETQKKWICEWEGCPRQNMPHASGYALRAHMRSHTKEKPFFCKLPECDRSFTRSDALAKHMRTVHEAEALRGAQESNTRNQPGQNGKQPRIKLVLKANGVKEGTPLGEPADSEPDPLLELGLTEEDLSQPPEKLYRILKAHLNWSMDYRSQLDKECTQLEGRVRTEWERKELLFANYMESELFVANKRCRDAGAAEVQKITGELLPQRSLPLPESAWYRAKNP